MFKVFAYIWTRALNCSADIYYNIYNIISILVEKLLKFKYNVFRKSHKCFERIYLKRNYAMVMRRGIPGNGYAFRV